MRLLPFYEKHEAVYVIKIHDLNIDKGKRANFANNRIGKNLFSIDRQKNLIHFQKLKSLATIGYYLQNIEFV